MGSEADQIGRYKLVRRLASGGMGDIYLAHLAGAGGFLKEVALKLIRTDRADSPELHKLFLREGRALAALRHRNIVQVFELDRDGEQHFMVMEYLQGLDAQCLLARSGPLPWPAAAYIGAEVARGLSAAHDLRLDEATSGIVHGDVTPANIMLCHDGEVKLLDFGVARPALRELTSTGTRGKLAYLPPELVSGMRPDARTDVYSLGVCLYELVCGKNPFRGDNELETFRRIMHDRVPGLSAAVPGVPASFESTVLAAMARDCAARPGSAAILAAALDTARGARFSAADVAALVARFAEGDREARRHEETVADSAAPTRMFGPPGLGTEADTGPRRPSRRRTRWLTAAAAVVCLAVASVMIVWPRPEPAGPDSTAPASGADPAPAPASGADPAPAPASGADPAPAPASGADPAPAPASGADPAPAPASGANPAPAPASLLPPLPPGPPASPAPNAHLASEAASEPPSGPPPTPARRGPHRPRKREVAVPRKLEPGYLANPFREDR